jgi:hypothetical protein
MEADMRMLTRTEKGLAWLLQVVVAAVLLQTLYFKFTGAPESVYIFTTLGLEPWGRIGSGVAELIAAGLLLTRRGAALGALLALAVITGALASHLGPLGIEVMDDGGLLFLLAVVVFAGSATVLVIRRGDLPVVGPRLAREGGHDARLP